MEVHRGEVFYADLSPVVGSEQGGVRPVLILQNDVGNRHSPTVIAAAITSKQDKTRLPTHIQLPASTCGLTRDSIVLLEQIRTLDKRRLREKTGIDLPGEAGTIMHKKENMGPVELATVSFGQSFQITPIQLITTAASIVNGGRRVTPHLGVKAQSRDGSAVREFVYEPGRQILSEETSAAMRYILEQVVAGGSGRNAQVEGFSIGGKTATSQTLPRSANKYIASFLGFAPADDPQILGMVIIHDPQGVYYGGTIAAPVLRSIYDNVLPYLGIEKK